MLTNNILIDTLIIYLFIMYFILINNIHNKQHINKVIFIILPIIIYTFIVFIKIYK